MGRRMITFPTELGSLTTRAIRAGNGPDMLLLHGAGSRADRWVRCIPQLADAGYQVTAIDLPGHGFADKPLDFPYTAPAMTDLLLERLDKTGPSVLVGTSLGGFVAALAALARPDLVKALVLVGVTGIVPRDASTARVISDPTPDGVRRKLQQLLVDTSVVDDAWVAEESLVNTSPGAEVALRKTMAYLTDEIAADLICERLAEVSCPLLLCWGEQDSWIPLSIGERISDLVPEAPFVVLRRCGHAPYLERAEDFASIVTAFLDPASRPHAGRQDL
jgi:2-hydroxy-6-oxonona-2,4-dienedioate hydrolase